MDEIVVGDPLVERDISSEEWREYSFNGRVHPYRIVRPKKLFFRSLGTTHRIVDAEGITHCVPAPGHCGCVLRWKADPPVSF
jgi:hypothetical protein